MTTVAQSSMARGTRVGSSAASISGGRGLAASSVGPDSGGEDIRETAQRPGFGNLRS